ncbi:hypothetical protein BpHYR1_017154 [Brachionus plicatilis]|uniref:Uncharacterized protein n=1 Tax=Brachionus plicatilis TaxID=10195 RepID=A0A3M7PDQ1_BRAPC|nr:hypothetical protein BpHYR1_017154 [Brachionus plicatilis]
MADNKPSGGLTKCPKEYNQRDFSKFVSGKKSKCPLGYTEEEAEKFKSHHKPSGGNTKCPKEYNLNDFGEYAKENKNLHAPAKCPFGYAKEGSDSSKCPLGYTEAQAEKFMNDNKPSGGETKCPKQYNLADYRKFVDKGSKCPLGYFKNAPSMCPLGYTEKDALGFMYEFKAGNAGTKCPKGYNFDEFRKFIERSGGAKKFIRCSQPKQNNFKKYIPLWISDKVSLLKKILNFESR